MLVIIPRSTPPTPSRSWRARRAQYDGRQGWLPMETSLPHKLVIKRPSVGYCFFDFFHTSRMTASPKVQATVDGRTHRTAFFSRSTSLDLSDHGRACTSASDREILDCIHLRVSSPREEREREKHKLMDPRHAAWQLEPTLPPFLPCLAYEHAVSAWVSSPSSGFGVPA